MTQLYYKDGRRYKPWGLGFSQREEIPDGLWLISTSDHSRRQQSMAWRVGELPNPVDCVAFMKAVMSEDMLIAALENSGATFYDASLADVAHSIMLQAMEVWSEEENSNN